MTNQRQWQRWLTRTFLVWAVTWVICIPVSTGAEIHRPRGKINICEQSSQIKNYLAMVERAAPVRKVPSSGRLPFGPLRLSLQRLGSGPKVGGGLIGFAFRDEAINWSRRLNWVIDAALVKVDENGKALEVIARKSERVGRRKVQYETVTGQRFTVSKSPAYYRVDLTFTDFRGRKLGSYSEYFRVMNAKYLAMMTLSDNEVMPGERIQARIENRGTEPILAEVNIAIEHHDGAGWDKVATVYRNGKVLDASAYVFGGEAGPCFTFQMPVDLGSGNFRVTERVRRYLRQGQQTQVSKPFQVGPLQ